MCSRGADHDEADAAGDGVAVLDVAATLSAAARLGEGHDGVGVVQVHEVGVAVLPAAVGVGVERGGCERGLQLAVVAVEPAACHDSAREGGD